MGAFHILLTLFAVSGKLYAADYGYTGTKGVSQWANLFITCGGNEQSPINIDTNRVKTEYWKPFRFDNYDALPTRMRIKNNGHSAQVEIDAPSAPRVSEGGLKGEYIFAQFHFHWGSSSSQGSEHTVDGVRYPMELHLVHYKAQYGSLAEAIKHRDGLAVLGIFFEVGATDNAAFTPIVNALSSIKSSGNVGEVSANYALSAYLPYNRETFFRYMGSLTTPTCNEVVIWTVFRTPVSISENQLNKFRELIDDHNHALVDNYRPPQPINHRQVYASAAGCDASAMEHMLYHGCTALWPSRHATCGGNSQSPINILPKQTVAMSYLPFTFKNYELPLREASIKNNGHSAQVTMKPKSGMYEIIGGGLPGAYEFAQFHFHWGSTNVQGSEHTVEDMSYPMEMHLVHFKKMYKDIESSLSKADGLAVLGVFFKLQEHDNPDLQPIISALKKIQHPGDDENISKMVPLSYLLPSNTENFYRYEGSLTTPTCNEVVIWTVFETPVGISQQQLKAFRALQGDGHHPISNNFRPVQKLHGRTVYRQRVTAPDTSSSTQSAAVSLASILTVALAAWV